MQRVFHYFFFTCLSATQKILLKEENRIGRWDRILLKVHTTLCPPCKEFESQNEIINQGLHQFAEINGSHGHLERKKAEELHKLIQDHMERNH